MFSKNKSIKRYIPNSVTHLTLGHKFNKNIIKTGGIPSSVKYLIFNKKQNWDKFFI